jgi:membrane-associated phospholipid phosphatase
MEEHIEFDRALIRISRVMSWIFTPFSIPVLAFLVLFILSYLSIMPLSYKLFVLGVVVCFTMILPMFMIYLFSKLNNLTFLQLNERKRRYVPFLLTIFSHVFCFVIMQRLRIPWYMTAIIIASLLSMIICTLINLKWKISEHMVGAGGVIGGLISFSTLFAYNPIVWLSASILIAGILGSARITLGHHTLGEVLSGLLIGMLSAALVIHPALNTFLLRYILF